MSITSLLKSRFPTAPVTPALLAAVLGLLSASVTLPAQARAYLTETAEGHTLRCSTIRSDTLPATVLQRYAVSADRATGVFSCVVQYPDNSGGDEQNRSADLNALARNLTGVEQVLEVREVLDDDNLTYLATYAIPVNGPLTFEVEVLADSLSTPMVVVFDDVRPQEPLDGD